MNFRSQSDSIRRLFDKPVVELYKGNDLTFLKKRKAGCSDDIVMIDTASQWEDALTGRLEKSLQKIPLLALEVSFVNRLCYDWLLEERRSSIQSLSPIALANVARERVSLIHFSTMDGLTILIRTCLLTHLPKTLIDLLIDRTIIKVGRNTDDEQRDLFRNWGVVVDPWLDIRQLLPSFANRLPQNVFVISRTDLADLPSTFFGSDVKTLNDYQMLCQRFSCWANLQLTQEQITYATYTSQMTADMVGVILRCLFVDDFERYEKLSVPFSSTFASDLTNWLIKFFISTNALPKILQPQGMDCPFDDISSDEDADDDEAVGSGGQVAPSHKQKFLGFMYANTETFEIVENSLLPHAHHAMKKTMKGEGRLPSVVRKATQFMCDSDATEFDLAKPVNGFYSDLTQEFKDPVTKSQNENAGQFLRLNLEKIIRQCPSTNPPYGNCTMHLKAVEKMDESDFFLEIDCTANIVSKCRRLDRRPISVAGELGSPSAMNKWVEPEVYDRIRDWQDQHWGEGHNNMEATTSGSLSDTQQEENGQSDESFDDEYGYEVNPFYGTTDLLRELKRVEGKTADRNFTAKNLAEKFQAIFRSHFKESPSEPLESKEGAVSDDFNPFAEYLDGLVEENCNEDTNDCAASVSGESVAGNSSGLQSEKSDKKYEIVTKQLTLHGCWHCGDNNAVRLLWEPIVPESYLAEYLPSIECLCNFAKLCHRCIIFWRREQFDIMNELAAVCNAPLDTPTYIIPNEFNEMYRRIELLEKHCVFVENKSESQTENSKNKLKEETRKELLNWLNDFFNDNNWLEIDSFSHTHSIKRLSHWLKSTRKHLLGKVLRRNPQWHHEYKVFMHFGRNPGLLESIFRGRFESIAMSQTRGRHIPSGWQIEHGCVLDRKVWKPREEKPEPGETFIQMYERQTMTQQPLARVWESSVYPQNPSDQNFTNDNNGHANSFAPMGGIGRGAVKTEVVTPNLQTDPVFQPPMPGLPVNVPVGRGRGRGRGLNQSIPVMNGQSPPVSTFDNDISLVQSADANTNLPNCSRVMVATSLTRGQPGYLFSGVLKPMTNENEDNDRMLTGPPRNAGRAARGLLAGQRSRLACLFD